jgi:hypothetical protein
MAVRKYTKITAKQVSFILKNFEKMNNKDLASSLGLKASQVRSVYRRNGLKRIAGNGRFEKGHVPANKGVKMSKSQYDACKKTMFKKGSTPVNHKPVGSERVDKDGYTVIKTKEPSTWELKHRVVWLKHNPPLKNGEIVTFKNGDKSDISLSNLQIKCRIQNMHENSKHINPKEIIPSLVYLTKIKKHLNNH